VFWVWVAVGLLAQGVEGWKKISLGLRFGLGWLALVGAWWAVAQARGLGVGFLLSVLTLVWMADIGAYFVGRACGGSLIQRKLAARISPGKSWEGALGGLLGVVLLAWAWVNLDTRPGASSLYALLAQAGWPFALLAVLFLGVMSVAGDLVESLIKRAVGVKDSSGLLPGHGGVLDRIDALLPVLPLAMMLASWLMPVTA
jgi:phosphatidate cytidylyltransferase